MTVVPFIHGMSLKTTWPVDEVVSFVKRHYMNYSPFHEVGNGRENSARNEEAQIFLFNKGTTVIVAISMPNTDF